MTVEYVKAFELVADGGKGLGLGLQPVHIGRSDLFFPSYTIETPSITDFSMAKTVTS